MLMMYLEAWEKSRGSSQMPADLGPTFKPFSRVLRLNINRFNHLN